MCFAILSMRRPGIKSPKRRYFDSESILKSDLKTSPDENCNVKHRCPKSFQNRVPKASQNRWNSCSGSPRVHPAAPMVLQGGPEVPKLFPRVLPRCQNGLPACKNGGTEHPTWQPWGNKKGAAAEDVALKINYHKRWATLVSPKSVVGCRGGNRYVAG